MTEIEMLAARLNRMDRRSRAIKVVVVIACIAITSLSLMGQVPGDVLPSGRLRLENAAQGSKAETEIRAESFILVDSSGKERASLVSDDNGSVYLVMFDGQGKNRLNLSVTGSGPSIVLSDATGQARTVIGSTSLVGSRIVGERTPASSVVLFDKDGKLLFRQ